MATEAIPELDAQYRALREAAALLDRSQRGKLLARGPEAAEFLQGQLTNDVEGLAPGRGCYCALLDRKGHVRADARVLRLGEEEIWLDTEAFATETLRRHLETYKVGREVEIVDLSAERSILSLLGPAATQVAGSGATQLAGGPSGPEHAHGEAQVVGIGCRWVSTDLGVDLIADSATAIPLREGLLEAGAVEVSEAAAEIARVEAGRARLGAEMSDATMPAEVGIVERAVDFEKGCYIGQETVARLHYRGRPNRLLRGLRLSEPVGSGTPLFLEEREVGAVATACTSPALGSIALAVLRREAEPGESLRAGDGAATAEVVELPFGARR